MAKNGYNIVIVGKSVNENPPLPGTIYSVAKEVEQYGVEALPYKTDIRYPEQIKHLIEATEKKFNRLDVVINNAGALFWRPISETEEKQFELINNVNNKGAFFLSKLAIPLLEKSGGGHIINQSPPKEYGDKLNNALKGKVSYMISKWSMTFLALGISEEYKGKGISANSLWPMTAIESFAVKNHNLGNKKMWRKEDIMVDAVLEIIKEDPKTFYGNQLIDEPYLRTKGYTDFTKYQCIKGFEPPKLNDIQSMWKSHNKL